MRLKVLKTQRKRGRIRRESDISELVWSLGSCRACLYGEYDLKSKRMRRGVITGLVHRLFIWDNDFMITQHDCGACHGYASGSIR